MSVSGLLKFLFTALVPKTLFWETNLPTCIDHVIFLHYYLYYPWYLQSFWRHFLTFCFTISTYRSNLIVTVYIFFWIKKCLNHTGTISIFFYIETWKKEKKMLQQSWFWWWKMLLIYKKQLSASRYTIWSHYLQI